MAPAKTELVWITEAMLEYGHGRGWFNRRIADGTFTVEYQPGTPKVFLRRDELERYFADHPEERKGKPAH